VLVSLAACALFAFVGLPLLTYYTGVGGLVKYWLMPWLGYHFWMSTFTVVHHTGETWGWGGWGHGRKVVGDMVQCEHGSVKHGSVLCGASLKVKVSDRGME
jgi:omega-6 fatty acid desaturase (delta-12 desaturase)